MSDRRDRVTAPGAAVEKLAGGFEFTEGPTCDARGQRLLHRPAQRPHPEVERGRDALHVPAAGRPRQRHVLRRPAGSLIACADEKTALWSIAPDGAVTVHPRTSTAASR